MLCVAASRFGRLPQRAEAAARGVSEGLPLAGDTGMLQGHFQGCAPEMPALKSRLYYLSAGKLVVALYRKMRAMYEFYFEGIQ